MSNWEASGKTSFDIRDDDTEWDGDKAEDQIFDWAGGDDDFDAQKAQQCFFAYDVDEPQNETSYKLPFCYIEDGSPVAIKNGIYAVAQVLEGARGGVDLPDSVIADVRDKVETYYEKLGEDVPW